jgi:hypothetical protein
MTIRPTVPSYHGPLAGVRSGECGVSPLLTPKRPHRPLGVGDRADKNELGAVDSDFAFSLVRESLKCG